jgi:hypothetical protein
MKKVLWRPDTERGATWPLHLFSACLRPTATAHPRSQTSSSQHDIYSTLVGNNSFPSGVNSHLRTLRRYDLRILFAVWQGAWRTFDECLSTRICTSPFYCAAIRWDFVHRRKHNQCFPRIHVLLFSLAVGKDVESTEGQIRQRVKVSISILLTPHGSIFS